MIQLLKIMFVVCLASFLAMLIATFSMSILNIDSSYASLSFLLTLIPVSFALFNFSKRRNKNKQINQWRINPIQ